MLTRSAGGFERMIGVFCMTLVLGSSLPSWRGNAAATPGSLHEAPHPTQVLALLPSDGDPCRTRPSKGASSNLDTRLQRHPHHSQQLPLLDSPMARSEGLSFAAGLGGE